MSAKQALMHPWITNNLMVSNTTKQQKIISTRKEYYKDDPRLADDLTATGDIKIDTNGQMFIGNTRYRKQSLDEPIATRLSKIYEETMLMFAGVIQ